MLSESDRARLRALGLKIPPEIVKHIVDHLRQGKSQYEIYKSVRPMVSQRTTLKIKKLMVEGILDFLSYPDERIGSATDGIVTQSDNEQVREILKDRGKPITRSSDPHRFELLAVIENAEGLIAEKTWSVSSLEKLSIPREKVLLVMHDYDTLRISRESAVIHTLYDEQPHILRFPGLEKYLTIHYMVHLLMKYPGSPFKYVDAGARLCARGDLEANTGIKAAGEDIIRYEIWRRGDYEETYYESLGRYYKTRRGRDAAQRQINRMLLELGLLSSDEDDDEIMSEIRDHMEDHSHG